MGAACGSVSSAEHPVPAAESHTTVPQSSPSDVGTPSDVYSPAKTGSDAEEHVGRGLVQPYALERQARARRRHARAREEWRERQRVQEQRSVADYLAGRDKEQLSTLLQDSEVPSQVVGLCCTKADTLQLVFRVLKFDEDIATDADYTSHSHVEPSEPCSSQHYEDKERSELLVTVRMDHGEWTGDLVPRDTALSLQTRVLAAEGLLPEDVEKFSFGGEIVQAETVLEELGVETESVFSMTASAERGELVRAQVYQGLQTEIKKRMPKRSNLVIRDTNLVNEECTGAWGVHADAGG